MFDPNGSASAIPCYWTKGVVAGIRGRVQISQRYLISSTFLFAIDICSTGCSWSSSSDSIYIFNNSICSANFPETVRRLIFGRCHQDTTTQENSRLAIVLKKKKWKANVVTLSTAAFLLLLLGQIPVQSPQSQSRPTCCKKVFCNLTGEVLKSSNFRRPGN